jgi:competence protein ComEA
MFSTAAPHFFALTSAVIEIYSAIFSIRPFHSNNTTSGAAIMKKIFLAVLLVFLLATATFAAVNINTATKEELNSLAGIGPMKAEAIIKYRQEKGLFKNVDELKNVYGIGDKLFERIKSDVTVGGADNAAPAMKPASTPQPEKKAEEKPAAAQPAEKKEAVPPAAPKKQ